MSAAAVTYTTFGGTIVHEARGGAHRDYMRDPLGSTVGLIDSTQTITDTFEYWPYGEIRTQTGSTGTPFTFVGTLGYFLDLASQFLYVRARYLVAALARWLTVDPLWPRELAYAYVSGGPTGYSDATGTTTEMGACLALYCAFHTARKMICDLSEFKDFDFGDIYKEVKDCLKDKGKNEVTECMDQFKNGVPNCIEKPLACVAWCTCRWATKNKVRPWGFCSQKYEGEMANCCTCCASAFTPGSATWIKCAAACTGNGPECTVGNL